MVGIGYFAEYHGKGYPLFEAATIDAPSKEKVLKYLRNSKVIAAAPGIMKDVFMEKTISGEMLAYSDGEYYWGSEAIYYFEKYDLKLPDAFIDKIIH